MFKLVRHQIDTIFALTVREMETEFGRYRLGYFWALAEPAIYITLMTGVRVFLRSTVAGDAHNMPPITFSVLGVVPILLFMRTLAHVSHTVEGGRPLLDLPGVGALDLIIARGLADLCTYSITLLIFILPAAYYENVLIPRDAAAVAAIFLANWLVAVGVGMVLAPIYKFLPAVEHFQILLVRMIFWTGGLFYTVDQFPTWIWPYLALNPVLHVTELMRQSWFQVYTSPIASPSYVLFFALCTWFLGTVTERLLRPIANG
jgi:capsular polysaccharide transport system permease protein